MISYLIEFTLVFFYSYDIIKKTDSLNFMCIFGLFFIYL